MTATKALGEFSRRFLLWKRGVGFEKNTALFERFYRKWELLCYTKSYGFEFFNRERLV